jgi:hypothetical protein
MANKRNKDALKRREERRRKKAVARKKQVHRPGAGTVRDPSLSDFELAYGPIPKLSAVILDYAKPLLDAARTPNGEENAIHFSIVCWNAFLLPLDQAWEHLESSVDQFANGNNEFKQDILAMFEMMQARKLQHFADDHRFVLNYHLTRTATGFNLDVISPVPVPPG